MAGTFASVKRHQVKARKQADSAKSGLHLWWQDCAPAMSIRCFYSFEMNSPKLQHQYLKVQ